MTKTDKAKHNISIASIKRSTMKPYNFKWTKFYESNSDFTYSRFKFDLIENELIICSTIIDSDNYSILTTQKLITSENGIKSIGNLIGAKNKGYGDFKGFNNKPFIFGLVLLENGTNLKYFIETGKASMIMIHGIRTFIKIQQMSSKNIENITRIYNKQNQK